jgi:RNA polymerase sigma factor (sigma-70 family)
MAATELNKVVGYLRSVLIKQDAAGMTDGDLLKCYVQQRDEAAFEALVRRHGPMVLGVCRRVLRNSHDAEDAFQATFLVLVRKASALRSPGMVGNWLYGVAYRTAQEARKATSKRRRKEAKAMPKSGAPAGIWADLREVLDQELERLPEKYRAVVVLRDLEGATSKEAARRLGLPEGTVASRVARGRTLLAKRLARHGFALSSWMLAAVLLPNASASVPTSLMASTIKAATLFAAGRAATGILSAQGHSNRRSAESHVANQDQDRHGGVRGDGRDWYRRPWASLPDSGRRAAAPPAGRKTGGPGRRPAGA